MKNGKCGTYSMPPIRAEWLKAHDSLRASTEPFTFAVCKTSDEKRWEVQIKNKEGYDQLDKFFESEEKAKAAGEIWLAQCNK